jgi:hypothetical protein
MEWALIATASALGIVSFAAAFGLALLVTRISRMMEAFTAKDRTHAVLTARQNEWTLGMCFKQQEEIRLMARGDNVSSEIRRRGLLPFMQDANSMVQAEIRAVMDNLDLSRDEAISYLRSRIPTPSEEPK